MSFVLTNTTYTVGRRSSSAGIRTGQHPMAFIYFTDGAESECIMHTMKLYAWATFICPKISNLKKTNGSLESWVHFISRQVNKRFVLFLSCKARDTGILRHCRRRLTHARTGSPPPPPLIQKGQSSQNELIWPLATNRSQAKMVSNRGAENTSVSLSHFTFVKNIQSWGKEPTCGWENINFCSVSSKIAWWTVHEADSLGCVAIKHEGTNCKPWQTLSQLCVTIQRFRSHNYIPKLPSSSRKRPSLPCY